MKKFGKFVFTTVSLAAAVGGAIYFMKHILNKDSNDDFDEFEDDFDEFDSEEAPKQNDMPENRGYVTLHVGDTKSNQEASNEEPATETSDESDSNTLNNTTNEEI